MRKLGIAPPQHKEVNCSRRHPSVEPSVTGSQSASRPARLTYLVSELVAGYPQDHKPLAAVLVVELVHLGVVPGGRASERRHILDQHHFTLQRGEVEHFSRDAFGDYLEKRGRHCKYLFFPSQEVDARYFKFSFSLLLSYRLNGWAGGGGGGGGVIRKGDVIVSLHTPPPVVCTFSGPARPLVTALVHFHTRGRITPPAPERPHLTKRPLQFRHRLKKVARVPFPNLAM